MSFDTDSLRSNSPQIFDNCFSDFEDDGASEHESTGHEEYQIHTDKHLDHEPGAHNEGINSALGTAVGTTEELVTDNSKLVHANLDALKLGQSSYQDEISAEFASKHSSFNQESTNHVDFSISGEWENFQDELLAAFHTPAQTIPATDDSTSDHTGAGNSPVAASKLSFFVQSRFPETPDADQSILETHADGLLPPEREVQYQDAEFPASPDCDIDTMAVKLKTGESGNHETEPQIKQDTTVRNLTDVEPVDGPDDEDREWSEQTGYGPEDWVLSQDDLYGPSMIMDNTVNTDPVRSNFLDADMKPKMRKQKFPRMFHTRSNADLTGLSPPSNSMAQQMMASSPLVVIAKYAKERNIDVAKMMERGDEYGLPMSFPCMQCFEKYGKTRETDYMYDDLYDNDRTKDGRCPRCGGQVSTFATFGKMISKLRQTLDEKHLVAHDVYPDGNCLFGAIVDQLHIHGIFQYTIESLRRTAVDYLRKFPNADDGTPFEMFLTEENWETYLERMSEDGEWGDHMVLSALSNVLQQTITIYGGISGQGETVIVPKGHVIEEEKKEETDVTTTVSERKETPCIYLGHFGESHYISLRPKDWYDQLKKRMNEHREKWERDIRKSDTTMPLPVAHINVILKHIFQLEYISSKFETLTNIMAMNESMEQPNCVVEYVGSVVNKLEPSVVKIESLSPDITMFFPSETPNAKEKVTTISLLKSPHDTTVVFAKSEACRHDLVAERDSSVIGHVKLIPRNPKKWIGFISECGNDKQCLVPFNLPDKKLSELESLLTMSLMSDKNIKRECSIAFKCRWPCEAEEWLHRHRTTGWPDSVTIQTVHSKGCHVIPVVKKENYEDVLDEFVTAETLERRQTWLYSFVVAEKEISRFLSESQRYSYLLFKMFVDKTLQNHQLPSAVLKSIFFHACERIEQLKWAQELGECLLILLKALAIGLQKQCIPHYFMSEKNLLQNIPKKLLKSYWSEMECARSQPMMSLYFLFDHLNLTSSEIGAFLDDVIDDSFRFSVHRDMRISIRDAVIPAGVLLLQSFIHQGNYRYAMLVVMELHDMYLRMGRDEPLVNIIKMASLENVGYQWCFALFIDLSKGTFITKDVCEGYSTVHITEVFGPESIAELPNTVIPSCFEIQTGETRFAQEVTKVLGQLENYKSITCCLRYYLDTYNDIAGDALYLCPQRKKHSGTHVCYSGVQLFNLYICLFNAYQRLNIPREFTDLMPRLTKLADCIGSQSCLKQLGNVWTQMGETAKAKEVQRQMGTSHAGTAMYQVIESLMGGVLY